MPPQTPLQQQLAAVWEQVLGISRIGLDDNFFELGGDSILSIQIVARAAQIGIRLSPKHIFRHQSIGALAEALADEEVSGEAARGEQGLLTGEVMLTPIQRRFFLQGLRHPEHYNQALLLRLRRRVSLSGLRRVLGAVAGQHDALRLEFSEEGGEWRQRYGGTEVEVALREVDLRGMSLSGQAAAISEASGAEQERIRLSGGESLLRATLYELGEEREQRLLLVSHHLCVDGVSWRILLEDMERCYEEYERGEEPKWLMKTSSYREWSARLRSEGLKLSEEELGYWGEEIMRSRGAVPLPVDFPQGSNTVASIGRAARSLTSQETKELLQDVPEVYKTQIEEVLVACLAEAIGEWQGESRVVLEMEGHGREELWEDIDLSRTVGWFTSLYPIVIDRPENRDLVALIKVVKEQMRKVPNRGIGYGVQFYLNPDPKVRKLLSQGLNPEVRFNYLGQLDRVIPETSLFGICDWETGSAQYEKQERPYLLDVTCAIVDRCLQVNIMYSKNIYHAETVDALIQQYWYFLRQVIKQRDAASFSLTPSDFPLAKMSQQQLEAILLKAAIGGKANE